MKMGRAKADDMEMDMTPMIDVVFLLIIFFMIVSQFSNLQVEELTLPYSAFPDEEKEEEDPNILVLNVMFQE